MITAKMLFMLFGGLALFIYGMHQMGDGLQKAAGEKMRRILQMLTGNPLMGVLVGALATMIVQSSSATTVMVVGFVSAGLMTLPQAFGVIMGANIGTTMTAWIVALKIDDYAWLFVAVGFLIMFAAKKPRIRYPAQILFAFGVLFVGLNAMSGAMKPIAATPEFQEFLLSIKEVPVLGLLVGTGVTLVVQSSSASIGVLQTLSGNAVDAQGTPLISLFQAIPILFGSNIGTTVTALLASIGGRNEAKRATLAHAIFNIVGSVAFMLFLIPYITLVDWVIRALGFSLVPDLTAGMAGIFTPTADMMHESIAIAHTVFNVVNTLIWLPFVWLMVRIVRFIFPKEDVRVEFAVLYLDNKVVGNPGAAVELVTKELARMADLAHRMTLASRDTLTRGKDRMDETRELERLMDFLENEIVRYLSVMISRGSLSEKESVRVAGLMHAANDIERIGDYCMNLSEAAMTMRNEGFGFSDTAITELDGAFDLVGRMVDDSMQSLRDENLTLAGQVMSREDEMDDLETTLRSRHMERLNNGLCNPRSTVIFLEVLHTMERISDHCKNIAEVVASGADYTVHQETVA